MWEKKTPPKPNDVLLLCGYEFRISIRPKGRRRKNFLLVLQHVFFRKLVAKHIRVRTVAASARFFDFPPKKFYLSIG